MNDARLGAHVTASNHVMFRIWAPDCHRVDLLIDSRTVAMERQHDGVFSTEIICEAGAKYSYCLDGDHVVPDPASRSQDGDVHVKSVVTKSDFPWRNAKWVGRPWFETVIYELHPGCFGGFVGIRKQLLRLAALGITAVELMPIADFPGRHNWGYDGVLPYAPDCVYGSADELKEMIDTAHGLNIQVFLDVVYNHFGPNGNYINLFAAEFFRDDIQTPWGGAIDFRRSYVRRFFIENALHWLNDYQFDGLRFDAVHAICDETFLQEMAGEIRTRTKGRHIHLILENENNDASLLRSDLPDYGFDAQWTDDWHHCLHVLLTRESEGYYEDFQTPAEQLARCLIEGFAYQGEPSKHANEKPRGTPSAHLPPTAFVICLQNHDQVGNRAMGDRLTTLAKPEALRAAATLLLMTPQIPMLFMGEEWGETKPFLFFTDHHNNLADMVREGRRKEFDKFAAFRDPEKRKKIPDPNDRETFLRSMPIPPAVPTPEQSRAIELHTELLKLRRKFIMPHLNGARSLKAIVLNDAAVRAEWKLGNGAILTIGANFCESDVACEHGNGRLLFQSAAPADKHHVIPAYSTFIWLTES